MAKLIFIQDVPFESFGVEFISGYLKSKGHDVDLIILNQEKKGFNLITFLEKKQPDVVGFSITTIDHKWSTQLAREIKKKLKHPPLTVFGGSHPTLWPDMVAEEGVDIICVGEGEFAMAELMENIDKGISVHSNIQNFYVKLNGHIIKNPMRQLIANHDEMPFPDRDVYYNRYPLLSKMTTKKFFSGRGCPYNCTYCNNHVYRKMFKDLGQYVSYRSPEKVIEEIKEVINKSTFIIIFSH